MLAPDAEYCATMTLHGRNDQPALPAVSNPLCARVRSVDASGAGDGCSFGGRPRAGWGVAFSAVFGLALLRRKRW